MIRKLLIVALALNALPGQAAGPCIDQLTSPPAPPKILLDPRGNLRARLWTDQLPRPLLLLDASSDEVTFPRPWAEALKHTRAVGYIAEGDALVLASESGETWLWHISQQRVSPLIRLRARYLILTTYLFGAIMSIEYDPEQPPVVFNTATGRRMLSFDDLLTEALAPSAQRIDF